ncbi:hypothetical protein [Zobellia galactanivorans]|uniref:hypothetical protein n=1 Tax=Zobellia galactanivorans (strain DSM 12802 / CCUG 47099 / CIP 106680 / NCIMB 13871 / Dsij) TaxID=63186 RepID=UPI001C06DD2C|nr:hypothetical protein [Zobellia galactanivorans]MBU3024242.1 hypothetical protein [Zobellia galactanivorans]
MIKYLVVFFFSANLLHAQGDTHKKGEQVKVGDVLEIGAPTSQKYKHIELPRANFIIKRGGLANYKSLKGNKVVVTSIEEGKDGATEIKIKRKDGGRFFGSHTLISADIDDALASGELLTN